MADMTEERQSCKKRVTSVSRLSLSVHWTQSRRSKAKLSKPTETSAVEPPPRKTLPYFKTLKMRLDSGEYDYRRSDVCSAERPKSKLPSREFSAKRLAEKCRHPLDTSRYTTQRPNANHTLRLAPGERRMPDEWVKTLADGRRVKFTIQKLLDNRVFMTAQIAGNKVVYSIILTTAKDPLSREEIERHFEGEVFRK